MRTLRRCVGACFLLLALAAPLGAARAAPAQPPTLRVQVIGVGTVTGSGISCGGGQLQCFAAYGSSPATVALTATPSNGWQFHRWVDGGSNCGSQTTCSQTVNPGETITAVFSTSGAVGSSSFDVGLAQTDGSGHGKVANGSDPSNFPIDCDQTSSTPVNECSLDVITGSTLTVTETPESGYFFNRWGGACSGSSVSCSVYLTDNRSVSAAFTSGTSTLTVSVSGSGSVGGDISCGAGSTCTSEEPANATVSLTAKPGDGYAFTGWSGDCSGLQTSCSVDMSTARTVTATFEPLVTVLVTIDGTGTVSGPGFSCGPGPVTCSEQVPPQAPIELTASSTDGSDVSWSGCSSSTGTICTIEIGTEPVSVEASFNGGTPVTSSFPVSVSVSGDGYVSARTESPIYCTAAGGAACTASVAQNTTVTLLAVPASGATSDFLGWGGSCSGSTATTCTLVISGSKSISARFNGANTTYTLTAHGLGNGNGSIVGAGLRCDAGSATGCASPEPANASVTVTAEAGPSSSFTGWSGACTGAGPTCTVKMSASQTVDATFVIEEPNSETLTLAVTGAGKVTGGTATCAGKAGKTTSCTEQYAIGADVTLKAVPASGYLFAGWTGACTGKKLTCAVTVTRSESAEATFVRAPLVLTKKPTIAKLARGYRVTFSFRAGEKGHLTAIARKAHVTPVRAAKTVRAGAGSIRLILKRRGKYTVTLTLRGKSGTHAIKTTVKA